MNQIDETKFGYFSSNYQCIHLIHIKGMELEKIDAEIDYQDLVYTSTKVLTSCQTPDAAVLSVAQRAVRHTTPVDYLVSFI